ncbi:MAG: hypothetical protein RMI34_08795 [Chloroherpetonaceae bacterium]|nr:hypothetical protein [Chloroherpetonaceae bacterium]MCS7212309.1 hypothetical protein [Chloroherpetonaceae bacterium]MDW8020155.1 hypothetical protein [Chloroherpetonaceae bacterium]MDW8465971.1 hypothetical protein [Chloroherpetonaceae bacterium]
MPKMISEPKLEPNQQKGVFSTELLAELRFEDGLLYRDGKRLPTLAEMQVERIAAQQQLAAKRLEKEALQGWTGATYEKS